MKRRDGGTFLKYPALTGLPALVRKQRKLEATMAKHEVDKLIADEKLVRAQIFQLLEAAGVDKNFPITCNGYDVIKRHQDGQQYLDRERLLLAGVEPIDLAFGTLRHKPKDFAEVKPSKGSKVRRAA